MAGFFMRGRMAGMRFRKLRIAWSVFWALACVLMTVLWVRSYNRAGILFWHATKTLEFTVLSNSGKLSTSVCDDPDLAYDKLVWRLSSVPWREDLRPKTTSLGFKWGFNYEPAPHFHCHLLGFECGFNYEPRQPHFDCHLMVSFWFLVLASAAAIAIPWIHWSKRFSYVGACQVMMGFYMLALRWMSRIA
jgi:hypothetical protein